MSAPGGSPGLGRPPRSPVGTPRTPAGQRVPRLPNIERGIRLPPPATMAIHGSHGPQRGLVPSVRRILNLGDVPEDAVGPAVMPLGPGAGAPIPMNMNVTPPRAGLAQALGAPRRPPPPSRLAPPPPFLFPPSPPSPPPNVRTPNRSRRRGRKHSRKQSRKQVRKQKHTRRRR